MGANQTDILFANLPVGSYVIQEIKGSKDGCYPVECRTPDSYAKTTDGFYATVNVLVDDASGKLYVVNTTDGLNQTIRGINGRDTDGFTGDFGYKSKYDAAYARAIATMSAPEAEIEGQYAGLAQLATYENNGKMYNNVPTGSMNKEVYGDVGAVKHDFDICTRTNLLNTFSGFSKEYNQGSLLSSSGKRVYSQGDGSVLNVKYEIINSTGRVILTQDNRLVRPNELCATVTVRGDIFTNDDTPVNLGIGARTGGTNPPHVTARDTIDNYLPFGKYTIKEIIGDNVSYLLEDKNAGNTESTKILNTFVSEKGLNYKLFTGLDSAGKPIYSADSAEYDNSPKRGGFQVRKLDTDVVDTEHERTAQGDATLAGAEFTVINRSENPIYYKKSGQPDKYVEPGNIIDVLVTDEDGWARTDENGLPYGTYEVMETKNPVGYLLEDHNSKTLKTVIFTIIEDDVIRGGLQVQKWDVELDKSEALGGLDRGENTDGTHLDGIVEYQVPDYDINTTPNAIETKAVTINNSNCD